MKTQRLLNDICYEQKATNRQLQRLSNIALIGILARLSKNVKDKGDTHGKNLCKAGLILAIIAEGVLLISECLDYRSKRVSQQLIEIADEKEL